MTEVTAIFLPPIFSAMSPYTFVLATTGTADDEPLATEPEELPQPVTKARQARLTPAAGARRRGEDADMETLHKLIGTERSVRKSDHPSPPARPR
ncbi:hypothetical protein Sm713_15740 [Streptomyces sp. TS71-3]|nr:hypothetical protein Sm713_15740 [Streptomyces sp. TS71-3]